MFMAFVLAILVIVSLVTVGGAIFAPSDYKMGWIISAVIAVVLTVVAFFFACVRIIGPTEVGVPVSFGTVGEPVQSGMHIVAPWIEMDTYPTRPVTVELSGDQKILARTADAGQMQVEVSVRWKVDPTDAKDLYLQVRTGDDDRISNDIVLKALRQAVGTVYSQTHNLDALNDRTMTTNAILSELRKQMDVYGIEVDNVNLRSVEPDEKTASTIALFSSQQQATRIAEEAKKTATIESQRRLIEAQGLENASEVLSNISPESAQILCMQIWQQTQGKAIDAGVPLYTNPCGSESGVSVITQAQP